MQSTCISSIVNSESGLSRHSLSAASLPKPFAIPCPRQSLRSGSKSAPSFQGGLTVWTWAFHTPFILIQVKCPARMISFRRQSPSRLQHDTLDRITTQDFFSPLGSKNKLPSPAKGAKANAKADVPAGRMMGNTFMQPAQNEDQVPQGVGVFGMR